MKRLSLVLTVFLFSLNLLSQDIRVLNYKELNQYIEKDLKEDIIVVNFWATWCKPCVQELPVFEKINKEYKDKQLKVLLVSLDFSDEIEKRLIPFLNKRKIESTVLLLDDPDTDTWINKVDKNWEGDIPYTMVIHKQENIIKRHSGEITYTELVNLININ